MPPKGAKVSHARPVRAGDESMDNASSRERNPRHLSIIVDVIAFAQGLMAHDAKVGCRPVIQIDKDDASFLLGVGT